MSRREHLADFGFVLLLLACIVLTLLAVNYHGERLEATRLAAQRELAGAHARQLLDKTQQTLKSVDVLLQGLLETGYSRLDPEAWQPLLDAALRHAPYLRSLSLANEHNEIVASSNPANRGLHLMREDYQPPGNDWEDFLRIGPLQGGRDLHQAQPIPPGSPAPATAFFPVSRGLGLGEAGTVSLIAVFNPDYFLNAMADFVAPASGTTISVLRLDGSALLPTYPTPLPVPGLAHQEPVRRWQHGEETGVTDQTVDDHPHIVAWQLSPVLPLGVVAQVSHASVMAQAREENRRHRALLLPPLLLALGVVLGIYLLFRRAARRERRARLQQAELLNTVLDAQPAAILLIDAHGRIVFANPSWQTFVRQQGLDRLLPQAGEGEFEVVGALLDSLTPAPYQDEGGSVCASVRQMQDRQTATTAGQAREIPLHTPSGRCWIKRLVRPCLLHGQSAVLLVQSDITQRKEIELALARSEERYRLTIDAVQDGIWDWDLQTDCLHWDARSFALLGHPPDAFPLDTGRWLALVHPDDRARVSPDTFQQRSDQVRFEAEFRLCMADGSYRWFAGRGSVVQRENGRALRAMGTLSDIQARRQAEERLRILGAALDAADNAIVITGADAIIQWANPAFSRLTGYPLAAAIGHRPSELVRSGLQDEPFYRRMWDTILAGEVWRGELVNRRNGGALYHESLTITPILTEDGELTHFIAVKEDISARKAAERALEALHARLSAVIDAFHGGLLLEDQGGHVLIANEALGAYFGLANLTQDDGDARALARHRQIARLCADPAAFLAGIEHCHARRTPVTGEEIALADGRVLARDFTPIAAGGTEIGYLWVYRDVSDYKARERSLHRLASTDPLTGLRNRRAFLEQLALECARQPRRTRPAAVLMFDLDHFKQVNDSWGHATGDQVLQHFSALAGRLLRAGDVFGRLGGEEFAALLLDTDREQAAEVAERIRAAVADTPVEADGQRIRITVSIGAALFGNDEPDPASLLSRADAALYTAKHRGRNRVCGLETA